MIPNKLWLDVFTRLSSHIIYKDTTESGCWYTDLSINQKRPVFSINSNISKNASRIIYELYFGRFNEALFVCHKCNNKLCVNPYHLYLGNALDNGKDLSLEYKRGNLKR